MPKMACNEVLDIKLLICSAVFITFYSISPMLHLLHSSLQNHEVGNRIKFKFSHHIKKTQSGEKRVETKEREGTEFVIQLSTTA